MKNNFQKHLIQCHCVLPQFRKSKDPIFHKIPVFSEIKDNKFLEKYIQCENCGIIHKVVEFCKSEIVTNYENLNSLITKEEIAFSLPEKVVNILNANNCHISDWEHLMYILENKIWNSHVVIARETVKGSQTIKIIKVLDSDKFKIESHTIDSEVKIE